MFVNMLGEEFELLRNYIDNYHNFYKLGYKNPNSIPDNLLPILGDTLGWKLLSPITGSSFHDYASSNTGDSSGVHFMQVVAAGYGAQWTQRWFNGEDVKKHATYNG